MKFILILSLWYSAGTSVAVVPTPFDTRQACQVAGEQYLSIHNGGPIRPAKFVCVTTQ